MSSDHNYLSPGHQQFKFWWILTLVILTCILFAHHLLKIYTLHGWKRATILTDILSLTLMILAICGLSIFLTTDIIPPDHVLCTLASHWKATGYSLFKAILYCICILRCCTAFRGCYVQYEDRKLKMWALFLLMWALGNIIARNVTTVNIEGSCITKRPPLPVIISIALLDLVSCTVNTILFSRPLFKLHRMIQNTKHSRIEDKSLKTMALKQCILSLIAITSTMAALGIMVFLNLYYIAISLDYFVSALCTALMYSWHSTVFEKVCCCLIAPRSSSSHNNSNRRTRPRANARKSMISVSTVSTVSTASTASRASSTWKSSMNSNPGLHPVHSMISENGRISVPSIQSLQLVPSLSTLSRPSNSLCSASASIHSFRSSQTFTETASGDDGLEEGVELSDDDDDGQRDDDIQIQIQIENGNKGPRGLC